MNWFSPDFLLLLIILLIFEIFKFNMAASSLRSTVWVGIGWRLLLVLFRFWLMFSSNCVFAGSWPLELFGALAPRPIESWVCPKPLSDYRVWMSTYGSGTFSVCSCWPLTLTNPVLLLELMELQDASLWLPIFCLRSRSCWLLLIISSSFPLFSKVRDDYELLDLITFFSLPASLLTALWRCLVADILSDWLMPSLSPQAAEWLWLWCNLYLGFRPSSSLSIRF